LKNVDWMSLGDSLLAGGAAVTEVAAPIPTTTIANAPVTTARIANLHRVDVEAPS
jgi:hypothetical protein